MGTIAKNKTTNLETKYPQCFKNGLLMMDNLLDFDNYEVIEELLLNSPIHYCELVNKLVEAQNYSKLFHYAVDSEWRDIADIMLDEVDSDEYQDAIQIEARRFFKDKNYTISDNEHYFIDSKVGQKFGYGLSDFIIDIKQEFLTAVKKELEKRQAKRHVYSTYTKDYFETLLENKEYEILAIKLCTAFEAILYVKGFEGDFSEMLTQYCDTYMTDDRESVKILHKLRKARNQFVHVNCDDKIDLSDDELRFCIDYISTIGA